MTWQPAKQTIVIHVLSNIVRNKNNQAMKFGQFREYNMKNIFLEKPYTKCVGETSYRPFSKKLKLSIAYLWINSLNFYSVHFITSPSRWLAQCIKTKLLTTRSHFYKGFLKNKKRSGNSLPASCYAWFLQKSICFAMFYYLTKFHCLVVSTSWDIRKYMYRNCLLARLWSHKFWDSSYLSNQAVYPTWPKSHDKNLNILRRKRAFKMK